MKRVLITGINGFAGSHLAKYLLENNLVEVHGTIYSKSASLENIEEIRGRITLHECDITDYASVEKAISESAPGIIFHLAAQAFVPESIKNPEETVSANIFGSLNIFEAARKSGFNPTIQVASSGEVYGIAAEKELPLREKNALRPLNPYAVTKAAVDLFAYQYFKMHGLKTIVTRAFNHAGPNQNEQLVVSNWARQIAMIEKGAQEPVLKTGDLRNARDFTDVRDVVRAYWLAATKGKAGDVYNVCSGKAITLKQLFAIFQRASKKKFKVQVDAAKIRGQDTRPIRASFAKLKSVTEWKPQIPLQKTVSDTLDYWRARV